MLMLLSICAACIPAQTPEQLAYTPGSPAVVMDDAVQMPSGYRASVPENWRVSLSAADAPEALTLIAPDDRSVMIISVEPDYHLPDVPTISNDDRVIFERGLSLPQMELYSWLITTQEDAASDLRILARTLESISVHANTD